MHPDMPRAAQLPHRKRIGKQQRQVKFRIQPVKSRANVFDFSVAVVVLAVAQPGAAKVETQHRKTKAVQRLHGVKDNFVMQRSAKQWMRVTNHRCMSRIGGTRIEQGFEPSRRAFEKKRPDSRILRNHNH